MMKASSLSLAVRALLALLLMIGFYGLALGVAAGLAYVPYAEWVYLHRINFRIALFCLVGAGAILLAILPRPDRFEPPGVLLEPARHPRLHGQLQRLAAAVGQPMPAEVYLVPDPNAWVAQRGGVMGIGGRRVMGLGLPLLSVLSLSQLRAILVHEFGHFHGGDTHLGPLVYRTRVAIGRTLAGLEQHSSLLRWPFYWYGRLFLRVTHAVSRHQEFVADRLAARSVGSRPLVVGLRAAHAAAPAYAAYWQREVAPALSGGLRPPIAAGFSRFVRSPQVAAALASGLEREMSNREEDRDATHPPLPARIAAVQALPPGPELGEDPAALSLLDDIPELEARLLGMMAGEERVRSLRAAGWDEVGEKITLPHWEQLAWEHRALVSGLTTDSLPAACRDLPGLGRRLAGQSGRAIAIDQATGTATAAIAAALGVALRQAGWEVDSVPGGPVCLRRGENEIDPWAVVEKLAGGEVSATAWEQHCVRLGIAGLDLGRAAETTARI
jgi:heat shock protein HtpX